MLIYKLTLILTYFVGIHPASNTDVITKSIKTLVYVPHFKLANF